MKFIERRSTERIAVMVSGCSDPALPKVHHRPLLSSFLGTVCKHFGKPCRESP